MANFFTWGANEPVIAAVADGGDTVATYAAKMYNALDATFTTLNSYPWTTATTSSAGYMSAADKTTLNAVSTTYLPLAGGTITGTIKSNISDPIVSNSGTSGRITLAGGQTYANGALIGVYGKDHSSNPGQISLDAYDGLNLSRLLLKPDGTLTWNGKDIAVVNSFDTTTNGYIRFTNGLQLVWARPDIPSGSSQTGIAVTFEKPFSATPCIYTTISFNAAYGFGYAVQPINRTSTGCTFIIGSSSGGTSQTYTNGGFCYLAVGPWA